MVFPDLSAPPNPSPNPQNRPLAFVADRLLAFLIDFLIFTPLLTLPVSGLLRQIRSNLILDPGSSEATMMWVLFGACVWILAVLVETAFLFWQQATPGQKYLGLQVISWPHEGPLRLSQCLQRTIWWWFNALLFGIPLLEAFSHPLRRTLHDRVSDTLLVTVRPSGDHGPVPQERQFFSMWSWGFFVFVMMFFLFSLLRLQTQIQDGLFAQEESFAEGRLCEEIPEKYWGQRRLDLAVSLKLAGLIDEECLEKEADFSLWNSDRQDRAFGYLAKSLSAPEEMVQAYRAKVCDDDQEGEACSIVQFLKDEDSGRADHLRRQGLSSVSSRVLLLKEVIREGQYASAAGLIQDLQRERLLASFLEEQDLQNAWRIRENLNAPKGRAPASAELQDILKEFKERHGLQ